MILANVAFGPLRGKDRGKLEDAVEGYLVALFQGGQICGERFLTLTKGKLNSHVLLAAPHAMNVRHHSALGKRKLSEVIKLFGREPVWKILDDDAGETSSKWRGAPFLHVLTKWRDWCSPVYRSDGKHPVPIFILPVSDQINEDLYIWQKEYRELDSVWMKSGPVETPAYRQLADPRSALAENGRGLCREIENGTGIPTFYYLLRYWKRPEGESSRSCPGCGGHWKTVEPQQRDNFQRFHFKCDSCRLVSHEGKSADGRHARIGEFIPVIDSG